MLEMMGVYINILIRLNTWIDISDGLEISQFYKIGLSSIVIIHL